MGTRIKWADDGTAYYKYNYGQATKTALTADNAAVLDGDIYVSNNVAIGDGYGCALMLNFPDTLSLEKIGIRYNYNAGSIEVYVSNNSTDGIDGTWTNIITDTYTTSAAYQEFTCTPINCTWVRIYCHTGGYPGLYNAFVFGEYQYPRFEFWNTGETAELNTLDYPLLFADSYNSSNYNADLSFKLKNLDIDPHTYNITIYHIRYSGDTFIDNYFTISNDGGSTKLTTLTTASVAGNGFSEQIDVYADITAANNPADGYHYFGIKVTEI